MGHMHNLSSNHCRWHLLFYCHRLLFPWHPPYCWHQYCFYNPVHLQTKEQWQWSTTHLLASLRGDLDVPYSSEHRHYLPWRPPRHTTRSPHHHLPWRVLQQVTKNHVIGSHHILTAHRTQEFQYTDSTPRSEIMVLSLKMSNSDQSISLRMVLWLLHQKPTQVAQQYIPHVPPQYLLHSLVTHQSDHAWTWPPDWQHNSSAQTTQESII